MNKLRLFLLVITGVAASQFALSRCPPTTIPPCEDDAVKIGWGCGTYGTICCAYTDWKCPGSATLYRVWSSHPYWTCYSGPPQSGEYRCESI